MEVRSGGREPELTCRDSEPLIAQVPDSNPGFINPQTFKLGKLLHLSELQQFHSTGKTL